MPQLLDSSAPVTPGLSAAAEDRWILLAEDEGLFRELLRRVLERAGYQVVEARNGLELLTHLTDPDARPTPGQIDLVLSDVRMPVLSGLEVVCGVGHEFHLPPVVLMTGDPSPELRREARRAGVVAVLEKPFEFGHLLATIHTALAPLPHSPPGVGCPTSDNLAAL